MTEMATEQVKDHKAHRVIRNIYLYLVSMIGLITLIFGSVGVIKTVVEKVIFQVNYNYYPTIYPGSVDPCSQPYADASSTTEPKKMITPTQDQINLCVQRQKEQNEMNNRNDLGRELSIAIAQILIGFPLWLYHWMTIQKEYRMRHELVEKILVAGGPNLDSKK